MMSSHFSPAIADSDNDNDNNEEEVEQDDADNEKDDATEEGVLTQSPSTMGTTMVVGKPARITVNPYIKTPKAASSPFNPPDLTAPSLDAATTLPPPGGNLNQKSSNANLGRSTSTIEGREVAIRLYNIFARIEGWPAFQEITSNHIANDNLENLLYSFAGFVSKNPIPKNGFTDDLTPCNPASKKYCTWTTLQQYLSRIMNAFRDRFPTHPFFPSKKADSPAAFKDLLSQAKTEWERNHQQLWSRMDDISFGIAKTQPLYKYQEHDPHQNTEDWEAKINWFADDLEKLDEPRPSLGSPHGADLNGIFRAMFASASPLFPHIYRDMAKVFYTHSLMNRGGEIKWLRWSEARFHSPFQGFTLVKHMSKTLTGINIAMLCNPYNPFFCNFFMTGLLLFPGQGLHRSQSDVIAGVTDYIFPEEQLKPSTAVAGNIGRILKQWMPTSTTKEQKEGITAKSLRRGSITEVARHPEAGLFEVTSRSGHKNPTNLESYIDYMDATASLVSGRILCDHDTVDQVVVCPKPWWLPSRHKTAFLRVYDYVLAGCRAEEYFSYAKLHELGQFFLCSLIMHYNSLSEQFVDCGFCQWLRDVFRMAKITDSLNPEWGPTVVLEDWSRTLNDHFSVLNFQGKTNKVSLRAQVREEVWMSSQAQFKEKLLEGFNNNLRLIHTLHNDVLSVKSLVQEKDFKSAQLRRQVQDLSAKMSFIRSPRKSPSKKSSRRFNNQEDDEEDDEDDVECLGSSQVTNTAVFNNNASVINSTGQVINITGGVNGGSFVSGCGPSSVPVAGSAGSGTSTQTQAQGLKKPEGFFAPKKKQDPTIYSDNYKKTEHLLRGKKQTINGSVLLSQILQDYHKNHKLRRSPWPLYVDVPPSCLNAKSELNYSLELIEKIISPTDMLYLRKPQPEKPDPYIYQRIVAEAELYLRRLEGSKDPEEDKKVETMTKGKGKSYTAGSIGGRVRRVKAKIREATNGPKTKNQWNNDATPLEICLKLMEPGTPPGNSSLKTHFNKRAVDELQLEEEQGNALFDSTNKKKQKPNPESAFI
jgi:hypothetical protein